MKKTTIGLKGKYTLKYTITTMFWQKNVEQSYNNLIVDDGRKWQLDLINGKQGESIASIAVGTGKTPAREVDHSLEKETCRKPVKGIVESNYVKVNAIFSKDELKDTREIGIFNTTQDRTGTLIARSVHEAFVFPTDNPISIDYYLVFQRGRQKIEWRELTKTQPGVYTAEDSGNIIGLIDTVTHNGFKIVEGGPENLKNKGEYCINGSQIYILPYNTKTENIFILYA